MVAAFRARVWDENLEPSRNHLNRNQTPLFCQERTPLTEVLVEASFYSFSCLSKSCRIHFCYSGLASLKSEPCFDRTPVNVRSLWLSAFKEALISFSWRLLATALRSLTIGLALLVWGYFWG